MRDDQIQRMLRQNNQPKKRVKANALLIDWQDVFIKYPSVSKEIALRVFNLNQISKDWFENAQGQRISTTKVIERLNKEAQDKVYEIFLPFFIKHGLILSVFPYMRNKMIWYRFELYDLVSIQKEDNYVRCQEGFVEIEVCYTAVVKSAIDYMALTLQ